MLTHYNADGPEGLGDLRCRNGTSATILKPELPTKLCGRLRGPLKDGGLWSRRNVDSEPKAASPDKKRNVPRQRIVRNGEGETGFEGIGWTLQVRVVQFDLGDAGLSAA